MISPATILVVDDEQPVRNLMVIVLDDLGYDVLEASSGDEAIRLAEAQEADIALLVTDYSMPGMDGHTLAQRLRQRYPMLQVLYVTGGPAPEPIMREAARNEAEVLQKPFRIGEIIDKVKQLVEPD